jgi:hypothetical protein
VSLRDANVWTHRNRNRPGSRDEFVPLEGEGLLARGRVPPSPSRHRPPKDPEHRPTQTQVEWLRRYDQQRDFFEFRSSRGTVGNTVLPLLLVHG